MRNKKIEKLKWLSYKNHQPKEYREYYVQWEEDGNIYFSYDFWDDNSIGDEDSGNWRTLEYFHVIAFTNPPKGMNVKI